MFDLFKAKEMVLWFENIDSLRKFENTLVLDSFIERDVKKVNRIETLTGGFEDGHVEVRYPVKRNKTGDFAKAILYYNNFLPQYEVKLVG